MHAIQESDFPRAAALLHEGFPQCSPEFWMGALHRMHHYGGNAEAGVELGWFMMQAGEPVGVVLTPASLRHWPGGAVEKVVNLSSWYVQPAHRWRAYLMLRSLLADKSVTYTDLTPTPEVRSMLPKLGFAAVNQGVALMPVPLMALFPQGSARVRVLEPDAPWPVCGLSRDQVESHRALGCLPLLLDCEGSQQLIVCRRTRWRGLPVAQLVYAESLAQLLRHRAALARCLRSQGLVLFVHDTRSSRSTLLSWFRRRDVWYCRGADLADRSDAFASELCIVHADASLQPRMLPLRNRTFPQPEPAPPAPASSAGPAPFNRQSAPAPSRC